MAKDRTSHGTSPLALIGCLLVITGLINGVDGSTRRSSYRSFSSLRSSSRQTWVYYGRTGHIYGYSHYTRRGRYSAAIEPTICHNVYDDFMDNGTNYEWFICPNITLADEYNECCGDDDEQYCCRYWDNPGRVAGLAVGVIIVVAVVVFIMVLNCRCYCGNEQNTTLFQRLSTRRRNTANGMLSDTTISTVTLSPAETMEMPPPSYSQEHSAYPDAWQPPPSYPPPVPHETPYPPASEYRPDAWQSPPSHSPPVPHQTPYPPTSEYQPTTMYPPTDGYCPSTKHGMF